MRRLSVIGVGPGNEDLLTIRAKRIIDAAEVVFAAERHSAIAAGKMVYPLKPFKEACEQMEKELESRDVVVLLSGNPTQFSMTPLIYRRFSWRDDIEYSVIPGIGSIQMLFCELVESSQDALLRSLHGRAFNPARICALAKENETVVFLTDEENNPIRIAEALCEGGLGALDIAVGENLSYPDENIWKGSAEALKAKKFGGNAVVRIRNQSAQSAPISPNLADDALIRGKRPMTKEEIRMLSVCKLGLTRDAVVWDAGAGTGSVAMQCAMLCPEGQVYAIERESEGIELIRKNSKALGLMNVSAIEGEMPEALKELAKPTHVFIGGCGGEMNAILDEIRSRGPGIRVVLNTVTLKSAFMAQEIFRSEAFSDFECVQIQVSKSGQAGIMKAHNPIMILSASTK